MELSDVQLDTIEDAIAAIAAGELVVVVDDLDRENEGDLIMAASKATPEKMATMIRNTSGIICVPMLSERAEALNLPPMVANNIDPLRTAFTVSVDYKRGMTTGISATERSNTAQALANGNCSGSDFLRPGHIFPLIAREGGVLVRSGHTEAATDLAGLAGLEPVGVLAEIVNDDGSVKRLKELKAFAERARPEDRLDRGPDLLPHAARDLRPLRRRDADAHCRAFRQAEDLRDALRPDAARRGDLRRRGGRREGARTHSPRTAGGGLLRNDRQSRVPGRRTR